jgi:hypothetical protein
MHCTNRRLRQMYTALSALSARTLPTITSDLKVAARLRDLRGLYEDTGAVIRKIREAHPAPDDTEGDRLPVALMEARQQQIEELLDQEVELPDWPDEKRITDADLPKALKTGAAEENRAGVADVVLNLDILYLAPAEV